MLPERATGFQKFQLIQYIFIFLFSEQKKLVSKSNILRALLKRKCLKGAMITFLTKNERKHFWMELQKAAELKLR